MSATETTPATVAFDRVFDAETLAVWSGRVAHQPELGDRLSVIMAPPAPSGGALYALGAHRRAAGRDAWVKYLEACERVGLLDSDLVARLRSPLESQFRGAMAECLTCWFLSDRLRITISPRPLGQGERRLEFRARTADGVEFNVECKASKAPGNRGTAGDDADVLEKDIREANDQFPRSEVNVLVLVPELRTPVCSFREQIVKAVVGEDVLYITLPPRGVHGARGTSEPGFKFSGLMTRGAGGKAADGSRLQAFKRIGAVLVLEERAYESPITGTLRAEVRAVVVHCPFATKPIPELVFGADVPQLVRRGDDMFWVDTTEAR